MTQGGTDLLLFSDIQFGKLNNNDSPPDVPINDST